MQISQAEIDYHRAVQDEIELRADFAQFIEIIKKRGQVSDMLQLLTRMGYVSKFSPAQTAEMIVVAAIEADRLTKESIH